MGIKKELFEKSLGLHNLIAKRFGLHVGLVNDGSRIIDTMLYDEHSKSMVAKELWNSDYVRYRTLELVAEEINNKDIEGSCAEAGVFLGEFSSAINRCFSNRKIYLYDTYEGFDSRDLQEQMEKFNLKSLPNSKGVMDTAKRHSANEQIEVVKSRLITPENAVIRKGYFPDTVEEEKDDKFAFVSLDMDYYRPLFEGLKFFWPRMSAGGYIFMHDYNCYEELTEGAHKAIEDAQEYLNTKFHIVPLADYAGTLVIVK
ncbi:TylF/MycF/NovP-related O-methyltransferase [Butyrivibrio sp. VCB2001]|uniref:TylF/MycF/NovP-related O-methyltransferase n=1 Tax=Butyrivibrio sp. VCB2001 TaxID=1280667 RepID=UPI000412CB07|nr:TylF/MycF/NovP-related O-methyltransferase [Butyrivibrio sp. VCB2001]